MSKSWASALTWTRTNALSMAMTVTSRMHETSSTTWSHTTSSIVLSTTATGNLVTTETARASSTEQVPARVFSQLCPQLDSAPSSSPPPTLDTNCSVHHSISRLGLLSASLCSTPHALSSPRATHIITASHSDDQHSCMRPHLRLPLCPP